MYTGEPYHHFFMTSPRDRAVRERFQAMVLGLLGRGEDLLDFGAGTGIDAKTYAGKGHRTFVYEPSASMRATLLQHCREEIAGQAVIDLDSPLACTVQAVTANFAVLNHIDDPAGLFADLARVVRPGGFVLASMLNPYYLGDARYGWWRRNFFTLWREGRYAIQSESRIHRFAPGLLARAAAPHFRLERRLPRGLGMTASLYMFLLFRRL